MKLSATILRKAKYEKLPVEQMAMADLIYLGYTDTDAYLIAFPEKKLYPDSVVKKYALEIVSTFQFIKYSEKRRKAEKIAVEKIDAQDTIPDDSPMDKEQLAGELLSIARSLPKNSKERADVMMKYADLLQMKKDPVTEEKTIHFYMPLTCDRCELYQKTAARRPKKTDVEDSYDIPDTEN